MTRMLFLSLAINLWPYLYVARALFSLAFALPLSLSGVDPIIIVPCSARSRGSLLSAVTRYARLALVNTPMRHCHMALRALVSIRILSLNIFPSMYCHAPPSVPAPCFTPFLLACTMLHIGIGPFCCGVCLLLYDEFIAYGGV